MNRLLPRVASAILAAILCAAELVPAPLHFIAQALRQPDGRVIHCFASGDEYYNWLHDADGYTIIQDPVSGFYTYAVIERGMLTASQHEPGRSDPASIGLQKWLRMPEAQLAARTDLFRKPPAGGPEPIITAPTKGAFNNIIIFIRFSDEAEFRDSLSLYRSMCNAPTGNSMIAYFREVSYSQLTIQTVFYPKAPGATVVSFQDSHPRAYYQPASATNTDGYTSDRSSRETTLLKNAVNAVAADIPDTLIVDADKDGRVDNVCFVVSGQPTAWATLLWPHMSSLDGQNVLLKGARVSTYNFQLQQPLKTSMGVGVLCHEMFHSLGSPDLYHYTNNGITPVGKWDIMESNTNPPQHMNAHMKYRYGKWIASIPEISAPGTYTLNPLTSPTDNCYRIKSPYSSTEYFVVEYRKRSGTFESMLPGDGLLVYRINSPYRGNASGPPDEVYLYRPGGTPTANGTVDQAFFNSAVGRRAINDNTNPASFLSTGKKGGLNISNITAAGATISFDIVLDTQTVQLVSPLKNAQWTIGSTKRIGWSTFGVARDMRVEYSIDSGASWSPITTTARNSWYWTVPDRPSTECRLRIVDNANTSVRDSVDFVICPPFYRSQFNYDVTDTTKARDHHAILFLGDQFWTCRAGSDQFFRWTPQGEIIEEFYVSGTAALKGMTTDGTYVYGATGSERLPIIDPSTTQRIQLIMGPMKAQFITYDPDAPGGKGGLWIGEAGTDLVLITLGGLEIKRIPYASFAIPNVTGIAYDNYTDGGPYLWLFARGGGAGTPQYLWRLRLSDGTVTSLFHDVLQDFGSTCVDGLAGGLTIARGVIPGRVSLCGTLLGTPNRLFGYEFPDTSTVLLFEENFRYTHGTKLSSHGWTAFEFADTRPVTVADFGLYYPDYASSNIGRSMRLTAERSPRENILASFAKQTDRSVYAAALVSIDSISGDPAVILALTPENTGSPVSCAVVAKTVGSNHILFGLAKSSAATEAVFADSLCEPGQTYLIAVKYAFQPGAEDDSLCLWIDPVINGREPPPALGLQFANVDLPEINSISFYQGNSVAYTASVDGIRVATAWDRAVARGINTLDKSILIVDGTDEGEAPFAVAGITDSTVDAFYRDIFPPSATWDYAEQGVPRRELLQRFQLVVWHADHLPESMPHVIARPDVVELLQDYLDSGGKLLVGGWRVLKSFDWSKTPPLSFQAGSFVHDYLHVKAFDESPDEGDFLGATTTDASYHSVSVDSAKLGVPPYHGKLSRVEMFADVTDSTKILLRYRNDPASPFPQYSGAPCMLRNANPLSETVLFGFPLYFTRHQDAKLLATDILRMIGVSAISTDASLPDDHIDLSRSATLGPNYPNPITSSTTIPYLLTAPGHVRLSVHNALGQEVATLVDAQRQAGRHAAHWRGSLPPGMYVIRLYVSHPTGVAFDTRRMLVLR